VSRNRLCDFLADPDSRIFSRFTLIFTGAGSSMVLYYMPNSSSTAQPPPGAEHFAATRTKVPSHAKTVHFLYQKRFIYQDRLGTNIGTALKKEMRVSQVLFNATGSSAFPVSNLTIRGLEIRDTALTYYGADQASTHGMPTGGDWTLERSGAVLLEGTEFSTISECLFERIDGESLSHPCLLRRVIQPYYHGMNIPLWSGHSHAWT
jgi:hypothetical protein